MGSQQTFSPGDKVRLTGRFLRNTGQLKGGEGRKVWTVVECACGLCSRGGFVAVDERNTDGPRHIATGNLKRVGQSDHSADALTGVWVRPR